MDYYNGWYRFLKMSQSPEKQEIGAGVQTTITTNKYNTRFLVLIGNTFPLNKAISLSGLGFKYFKGTWSKKLDLVSPADRSTLEIFGVDLSVMDGVMANTPVILQTEKKQTGSTVPGTVENGEQTGSGLRGVNSPSNQKIKEFKEKIDKETEGATGTTARVKAMLNHIDKTLDSLAKSVDEAAKQDFIRDFLNFSSKFWQYSFSNMMLIYMQKPDATYVRGHKQWLEMGRQVVKWDEGISILAPMIKKIEDERAVNPTTGLPEDRRIMFFRPVSVYDISATQPIPNWKDKKGNGPFEGKPQLKLTPNEEDENITPLVMAAKKFAESVGVRVDLDKELPADLGGYSEGGQATINKGFKGINQFGTLVHELAHEALHWNKDKPGLLPKEEMRSLRQAREIDAESTAYIVLKYFGFETKDAPNYLALWKADSKAVRDRREHISNAVKIIIRGIEGELNNIVETPEEETVTSSGWRTLFVVGGTK